LWRAAGHPVCPLFRTSSPTISRRSTRQPTALADFYDGDRMRILIDVFTAWLSWRMRDKTVGAGRDRLGLYITLKASVAFGLLAG